MQVDIACKSSSKFDKQSITNGNYDVYILTQTTCIQFLSILCKTRSFSFSVNRTKALKDIKYYFTKAWLIYFFINRTSI